jgi:hypothetical protein
MSCSKTKETDYVAQNEEEISAYVAKQFDRSEKRFRIILYNWNKDLLRIVKGIQRLFY